MDTIKKILVVIFVSMALSLMLVGTTSAGCGLTHPSLHVELIGSTDSQMLGETEYFFAVYAINDKDCTFCDPAEDLNVLFQVDKGEIVSTNKYSFDSCTVDASNTLATFYRENVKEKESLIGYIWLKTPTSGSFTIAVDGIEVETDGGCIVNSNSITETYTIYPGLSEREYFAKLAEQRAETLTKYKEMYLSVLGMSGGSWEEYTNRQIAEAMALSIQFTTEVGNSINVDPTSANAAAKGMYAIFTDEIPFLGAPLRTFESILNVGTGMCEHLINYVAYYDYHEIGLMDELITLYNEEATAWRNCDDGGVALKKIFDDEVDHLQGNWISLYKTSSDLKNTAIQREDVGNAALFSSIVTFAFNDAFQTIPLLRASVEAVCNTQQSSEFTPLDLCMVLDRSGSMDESMGGKTRMQGVKEAAKGVVNVLLPQDRVSIVSFSDTATANIDLTSDFNAVKTKINAINAGGGTSFGAGLDTALDQFKAHGNPGHNPAILFMSDGEHNKAPDPEAYVTPCKNKGIPIFTVGFATSESEVDVTKLKMMSEETGGEYHFVSEIFDLQNIFLRLQHKASGWESVAAYVGEVNEGETITAGTFYVDPAIDDLRVTLNWPGSNLDLELFDPSSRQVDFSASNVIYSGDTKPEYVIIKDPQSGTWTAKVYGKSICSSEAYYVLVTKYEPSSPLPPPKCKVQITSNPSLQDRPSIVHVNGNYYIAYQSHEKGYGIYIKEFNSNWNFKKKVEVASGSAYYDSPSLLFANNKLYVAYITNANGANANDYDVIVKEYNPSSLSCTKGAKYLTSLQSCQDLPAIYHKGGYFYMAYQSWEKGDGDIFIKKFDSNLNMLKKVQVTSKSSLQDRPSITYANGYIYVAYFSEERGYYDIFVKRLDNNLNLAPWKEQITTKSSYQSYPFLTFVNNQFVISYASTESGTLGIYMKKYDSNWNLIEKTEVIDSSAYERRPSHTWDGNNFWIAYVYNQGDSKDWNIFAIRPDSECGSVLCRGLE